MLCESCDELDHDSDHVPVQTVFSLDVSRKNPDTRRAWKGIAAEAIQQAYHEFGGRAPQVPTVNIMLNSALGVDAAILALITNVTQAIDIVAPLKPVSLRAVRGFTDECKLAQAECRRFRRYAQRRQTPEAWDDYHEATKNKSVLFKKARRNMWRTAVQEASESPKSLWRLAKWARNRDGSQRTMPAIQDEQGVLQYDS